MSDAILTAFDEDCLILEDAIRNPDRLRIKSAVPVCRRMLLEGMIHKVLRQLGLRHRLEFRVAPSVRFDMATVLGLTTKPSSEVFVVPDGLAPECAPPGASVHTLTIEQFVGHRVVAVNGESISIGDVLRFLANKDGAVHYDTKLNDDEQKLYELNRSLQVMSLDVLNSCVRGIVRVLLAAVVPIRIEILRRFVCQAGTRAVPPTHIALGQDLARELFKARDWQSTKRLLQALLETSAATSPSVPSFEDHMMVLFQWGNVHLHEENALNELLWMRAFANGVAARLKPAEPLERRALSVLCAPMLIVARKAGDSAFAAELEQQLRDAYLAEKEWPQWPAMIPIDVLEKWNTASHE
jgi:hypothetical protein